jgi:hypothetical protein
MEGELHRMQQLEKDLQAANHQIQRQNQAL